MNPTGFILLATLVVLLIGCRPSTDPAQSDVVARVGSREIRWAALERESIRRAAKGGEVPPPGQLLEDLIQREAQLARVAALGLDRDPEVQRAVENVLVSALRRRDLEPRLETAEVSADAVSYTYLTLPTSDLV